MAPQLIGTNGWFLRVLREWTARATSSLPTPLSPWMRTVVLKSAIFVIVRKMSVID